MAGWIVPGAGHNAVCILIHIYQGRWWSAALQLQLCNCFNKLKVFYPIHWSSWSTSCSDLGSTSLQSQGYNIDMLLNTATLNNVQCSFTSLSVGCCPEAKTQVWDSAKTLCPDITMPWASPCSSPLPSTCTQLSPGCFTWARWVKLLATALHFRLLGFLRLKVKSLQPFSVSGLTASCK